MQTSKFKSQTQMAKAAGISKSMLSLVKQGKRRPKWVTAEALGKALGKAPAFFMTATADEIETVISKAIERGE